MSGAVWCGSSGLREGCNHRAKVGFIIVGYDNLNKIYLSHRKAAHNTFTTPSTLTECLM